MMMTEKDKEWTLEDENELTATSVYDDDGYNYDSDEDDRLEPD